MLSDTILTYPMTEEEAIPRRIDPVPLPYIFSNVRHMEGSINMPIGTIAHVQENDTDYVYDGENWVAQIRTSDENAYEALRGVVEQNMLQSMQQLHDQRTDLYMRQQEIIARASDRTEITTTGNGILAQVEQANNYTYYDGELTYEKINEVINELYDKNPVEEENKEIDFLDNVI